VVEQRRFDRHVTYLLTYLVLYLFIYLFAENDIDGAVLMGLNNEDLIAMGISSVGKRKSILSQASLSLSLSLSLSRFCERARPLSLALSVSFSRSLGCL
jgi:hypothetical protein